MGNEKVKINVFNIFRHSSVNKRFIMKTIPGVSPFMTLCEPVPGKSQSFSRKTATERETDPTHGVHI